MVGGSYDITGFHTTGRQRLTQGLMAGHMRSQRTSIFPSKTVINNNIFTGGYADYGCYDTHCCDSTPKWMNWMMGIGLGTNLLGNIFGLFGGAKSDGAGGASDKPASDNSNLKTDIKALEKQYPDATFSILSDGSIMCDQEKYESLDEVINALKKNYPKTPEKKDKNTTDNSLKTTPDPNNTAKNTGDGKMTEGNTEENQEITLPKLFNDKGMDGLNTPAEVEAKFKKLAGVNPYKIDTNGNGGIIGIAHYFIFDFLVAFDALFYQYLMYGREFKRIF